MIKNINLILIFLILTSCSGFKLKKETVDEFLVEKKAPSVAPRIWKITLTRWTKKNRG